MNFSLLPLTITWAALALVVIGLIIRRKMVASHEDDNIHVLHPGGALAEQVTVAQKLEVIDKWGKIATVVTVAFGLIIVCLWVYQVWVNGSQLGS